MELKRGKFAKPYPQRRDESVVYRGHHYPGRFINFEGIDGSGKSTQYKLFVKYLKQNGYKVVEGRDPGGTEVGEEIRKILLHFDTSNMSAYTEILLFEASRAQLTEEIIKPALERGEIAVTDRFWDSTTAYQGAAGKVPLELILSANLAASQGIRPDKTNIFDAPLQVARGRQNNAPDRMERKTDNYHERVRQAFLGISMLEPDRVKIYNTNNRSVKEISAEVIKDFLEFVERTGYKKS